MAEPAPVLLTFIKDTFVLLFVFFFFFPGDVSFMVLELSFQG